MRRLSLTCLFILCCWLLTAMEVPFSTVPILTEANQIGPFVRIDPDDKKPETLPTKAWIWYDEENIYVKVQCTIDSSFVKGAFRQRDSDSGGDYLFLHLITNPRTQYAYIYDATPSGALSDCVKDIKQGSNYNWNSSYSYTTEDNDTLWTVIFTVPFKDMRFPKNPPYKWKIRLTRFHKNSLEYYSYPYYKDGNDKEFFDKAMEITLTHKISGKKDWKFRPYFVRSYDLVNKSTTFDPDNTGLDISFNPGTRTKLKIAVNPDFTDVPPDDATNIYNSKYPIFYNENRFFFIEDIDAFGTDETMFYTRNIVQPQLAVKFTGNHKAWNYGYLCAKDKNISEDGMLINPDDFFQLGSVIYKTEKYKFLFSGASRMNNGYYNHFGSGSWNWEFVKNFTVGSSHLYSTKYVEGSGSNEEIDQQGLFNAIWFQMTPGNWNISAEYENVQKDLALDMGYLNETGLEQYSTNISWNMRPREKYLRTASFSLYGDYANKLEPDKPFKYLDSNVYLLLNFLPKYSLVFQVSRDREEYLGKEHDTWNAVFSPSLSRWPAFNPTVSFNVGKTVIYSLNETKDIVSFRTNGWGRVGRRIIWNYVFYHYQYGYDETNYIYTPTDTLILKLDNSFQIANAGLTYNFSNKMSLGNGIGITTYKTGLTYSNVSFYSNFRYEFKPDWFLYLGYKTKQWQDEPSVLNDPAGHFKINSASAYLKLSFVL